MKEQLSEIEVEAEAIPFSFELRRSKEHELRPAPIGYIVDLKSLVFHLLNENDRYIDKIH